MLLEDLKLNARTARAKSRVHTHAVRDSGPWLEFRQWRKGRPFGGAVFTVLAGVEMFFSSQLDIGNIHVQVGIEGLQSTLIPALLVALGVLTMFDPGHRIFYGVIALVVSVYSLIGLNLGGFFVGMLLGAIGGVLIVSWLAKPADVAARAPTNDAPVEATMATRRSTAAEPRPLAHRRS